MSGCGDCDMQGTLVEGELHCDSCPESGEGSGPTLDDLYVRVSLEEPCQFVGVHPLSWHDHPEATAAFVEAEHMDWWPMVKAAPEMLAVCEAALRYLRKFPFETGSDHQYLCGRLSVAIANAKGERPC